MEKFEVILQGGKRVAAKYRGFTIETDQPVSAGGENTAPSPFEMFLTSLGTCAGFFVVSFCQQRGIPTEGIKIYQNMENDPATHLVSKIEVEIQLPAGFPEQYRDAVVRAADQCTVKRHLHTPPALKVFATTTAPAKAG